MSDTMIMMLAMLAAELVLLLLVLLAVAWFRGRAARRRDERAIRVLVTRIKNSRAERETGIERFLDERMGLSGAELAQAKQVILQSELVLLKRFAEVYRRRDADAAARFDADLVTALTPYHELKADNVVVASVPAPADNPELERLREQNQLLSDELSGNMETMSKMLREFSTMFAGSSGDAAATAAATAEPSAGAAESESVAADESAEPDLGTPESVDALFAEAAQPASAVDAGEVSESLTPAEEPVTAGVPEVDIAREANAEAQDQAPPESAHTDLGAAEPETPVQIEAGDDLEEVAERLEEEGPAEVVTFDDPDEFDAEAKGSESIMTTPTPEEARDADTAETNDNLDTGEEVPLKVQSRA